MKRLISGYWWSCVGLSLLGQVKWWFGGVQSAVLIALSLLAISGCVAGFKPDSKVTVVADDPLPKWSQSVSVYHIGVTAIVAIFMCVSIGYAVAHATRTRVRIKSVDGAHAPGGWVARLHVKNESKTTVKQLSARLLRSEKHETHGGFALQVTHASEGTEKVDLSPGMPASFDIMLVFDPGNKKFFFCGRNREGMDLVSDRIEVQLFADDEWTKSVTYEVIPSGDRAELRVVTS